MESKENKKDDLASEVKSSQMDYVPGNKIPGRKSA